MKSFVVRGLATVPVSASVQAETADEAADLFARHDFPDYPPEPDAESYPVRLEPVAVYDADDEHILWEA